ncbi:MAG: M56 family metallopeptidase, partial [Chloroflexota bacterium]
MIPVLIYMVKVSIYVVVFYLIYTLLLRKDTSHGRNRAFIILSLVASIILPSFSAGTFKPLDFQFFGKLLSEVLVTTDPVTSLSNPMHGPAGFTYSVYVTGVILFLFKLIVDFSSLLFLIIRQKKSGTRIIRYQNFNTAGFTAMGFIFINTRLSPDEAGNVIRHERNHLRQNHYIDIIFIEFMTAFQWFNPFIHLLNRELRAIHEFQADQGCLSSGIPVSNYQSLLLSQIFKSGSLKLTNSFSNPSLLRKRMLMMTRERTSGLANFKLLSVIPVAGFVLLSLSPNPLPAPPPPPVPDQRNLAEIPQVVVEEMPSFPGGDRALLNYITENIRYPQDAARKNIQGRVIVRFCITSIGGISQVSVLKNVDPALDA